MSTSMQAVVVESRDGGLAHYFVLRDRSFQHKKTAFRSGEDLLLVEPFTQGSGKSGFETREAGEEFLRGAIRGANLPGQGPDFDQIELPQRFRPAPPRVESL
jgi:hypothetical protein